MKVDSSHRNVRRRRILARHLHNFDAAPQAQDSLLGLETAMLRGMNGLTTKTREASVS